MLIISNKTEGEYRVVKLLIQLSLQLLNFPLLPPDPNIIFYDRMNGANMYINIEISFFV